MHHFNLTTTAEPSRLEDALARVRKALLSNGCSNPKGLFRLYHRLATLYPGPNIVEAREYVPLKKRPQPRFMIW